MEFLSLSLLAPLIYIFVLVGSLGVFSSLYRKRKALKAASLEPWFGPHHSRDIYLSLLHQETEPKVPDSLLKAALLQRAVEDISRVIAIRSAKNSLTQLLQKGSIGDDLWNRFTTAEKEIEEELRDVVNEANAFQPGWGQVIFQTANEIASNIKLRRQIYEMKGKAEAERAWWDKKREQSRKELTGEATSDDDAVLVEGPGQAGGLKQRVVAAQ
ncbi:hypothetical protein BJ508DRAFT_412903 [Ascobolus immersus RN42]|uniref:Translocation protein n=1 Tax=Ascobolus immersus RN42 TaxID=1160509 RepID=A0A3N4IDK2_ASCIM|nr:hypothetical protein BJ508DRAFT_412903 [Ascobolus immersus RN42]